MSTDRERNFAQARAENYDPRRHVLMNVGFGWLPAFAFVAIGLAVGVSNPLALLGITLLYLAFAEYAMHRWVFHRSWSGVVAREHLRHHRFFSGRRSYLERPEDIRRVLMPTRNILFFFLTLLLPPTALLALLGRGGDAFFILGVMTAQLWLYEVFHYQSHLPPNRRTRILRPLEFLAKNHVLHHRRPRKNFGVSTGVLGDWTFRSRVGGTEMNPGADHESRG